MSNPFTGGSPDPSGIMPRRPSYASVVSGPASNGHPARSGAFSHLLNHPDYHFEPIPLGGHTRNSSVGLDFYSSRNGAGTMPGHHASWAHNGATLPSFSRAFGLYMNGHGTLADGPRDPFFVPSYLQESQHLKRLAEAHKAKQAAQQDAASSSQTASLSTSGSSINLHAKAPSHRGMTFDLIEKAPPLDDDGLPPLPSRWNLNDKHASIEVMGDGLEIKLTGPKPAGERDHEACTVRADHYMPPQVGLYYFEITIMSRKREESSIGIGFSGKNVSLSRVPGWEPESWAYHGDDGHSFCCQTTGKTYGPKFSGGDVIGCGVNFRTGCAFFTKNGDHLGIAFRDIKGKLFPSVGMKKSGEQIRVNFGQSPFVYDIDGLIEHERQRIRQQIEATSTEKLAPPLSETQLIQRLVLQFLTHDGYIETAQEFAAEVNEEQRSLNLDPTQAIIHHDVQEDEDAVHRQRIRTAILEGDIDKALKRTNAYYPDVLANHEHIYFRLRCRKFIEMIRQGSELANGNHKTNLFNLKSHNTNNGHSNDWYDDGVTQEMELDDPPQYNDDKMDSSSTSDEAADYTSSSYQKLLSDTIAYGQDLQAEFKDDPRREVRKALDDAFALMAYPDPWNAKGVRHLLDTAGRSVVAEELNSAILVSLGKSSTAALEQVYQQTTVLLQDLRENGGAGAFVNLDEVVRGRW